MTSQPAQQPQQPQQQNAPTPGGTLPMNPPGPPLVGTLPMHPGTAPVHPQHAQHAQHAQYAQQPHAQPAQQGPHASPSGTWNQPPAQIGSAQSWGGAAPPSMQAPGAGGWGPASGTASAPAKSGGGKGLLIAVVVLAVAAIAVTLVFVFKSKGGTDEAKNGDTVESAVTATTAAAPQPPPGPPAPPPGKVEARNVRFFKDRTDPKTLHVLFELYNAGPGGAASPRGRALLQSTNGLALDKASCVPHLKLLGEGETVPCASSFFRGTEYAKSTVEVEAFAVDPPIHRAKLTIKDLVYVPPDNEFAPHRVNGKLVNESATPAHDIWAIVGLYDSGGQLAGVAEGAVGGGDLGPALEVTFSVPVYQVAAPVAKYQVLAAGYLD
jgi:hypothetical protein